jgi:TRAP-type C4-dicarboxylate transport system permease small subunit
MLENLVKGLKKGIFPISRVAAVLGVVILVVLVFIPLIDIFLRRLFNAPLAGAYELSEFALGMMVFTTLAYCAVRGMHIVVDIATSRLPERSQEILDTVIYGFSWIMLAVMSWQLISRALTIKADNETSTILYIPTFPFIFIAGLGCALLALVFFTQSLDKLSRAVKKWN